MLRCFRRKNRKIKINLLSFAPEYQNKRILDVFLWKNREIKIYQLIFCFKILKREKYRCFPASKFRNEKIFDVFRWKNRKIKIYCCFSCFQIPKQKNIRCFPASKYQNEKFFDVFLLQNTKTKKMIIYVVRMIDLIELNINFSTAFIWFLSFYNSSIVDN